MTPAKILAAYNALSPDEQAILALAFNDVVTVRDASFCFTRGAWRTTMHCRLAQIAIDRLEKLGAIRRAPDILISGFTAAIVVRERGSGHTALRRRRVRVRGPVTQSVPAWDMSAEWARELIPIIPAGSPTDD